MCQAQGYRYTLWRQTLPCLPHSDPCTKYRAVSQTPGEDDLAVKRFFCRTWAEERAVRHELHAMWEASSVEACLDCQGAFAAAVRPEGVEFFLCMT
jgi:hypothetical protein